MKSVRSISMLITLLLAASGAFAQGGQGVGSGGDALRQLLEQARFAAVGRMSAIGWCSFSSSTSPQISEWILEHQSEIIRDVQNSEHLWVVDTQSTCGFTQHSAQSPIYFSYPTCAATVGTDLNSALFTLLHETAHHLGVNEEHQADTVARAILDANITTPCSPKTDDVFDANICKGPVFDAADASRYLPPGGTRVEIGQYTNFARSRRCNLLTGCNAWWDDRVVREGNGQVATKPSVTVLANAQEPYYQMHLQQNFETFGETIAYGVPGALTIYERLSVHYLFSVHRDPVSLSGEIRKNCLWFKGVGHSPTLSDGTYIQSELVIYGTH